MAPVGTPAFSPVVGLPGSRSALLITTAAYADAQLAWLRPPVSGAHDLAAALADPRAGGFAVDMLTDGTETEIRLAVGRFLAGRSPQDTVLLYLSCHAIRDRARLYFAATDTWLRYPQRSALPAAAVLGELDRCGAGNRMLILDCCFSGGFAEEKGELDVAAELALDGRGIAVLSGSRAREYSYEGRPIGPELPRSVFTEGLAVGLATGAADADGNGIVTVAEAYNYAYRYVSQNTPRQAPQYYLEDGHGEIVLARGQVLTHPQAQVPMTNAFTAGRPRAGGALRGHADGRGTRCAAGRPGDPRSVFHQGLRLLRPDQGTAHRGVTGPGRRRVHRGRRRGADGPDQAAARAVHADGTGARRGWRHHEPGLGPGAQGGPRGCHGPGSSRRRWDILNFPLNQGTMRAVSTDRVVTAGPLVHSIKDVPSRTTPQTLTKRRAVDFCRVATAMCPRPALIVA